MGLTAQEHQHLLRLAPRVAALCDDLANSALPMSLHHGDLHDGNILVRDDRLAPALEFAEGDAWLTLDGGYVGIV